MLEWESVTVVWVIWATDVDVLPSDTSWLFEPTTGVHQFGGGSVDDHRGPGVVVVKLDKVEHVDPFFNSVISSP